LKELKANKLAEEPEFTINPYFLPNVFATIFSNFLT
jgi:hypothetical protein